MTAPTSLRPSSLNEGNQIRRPVNPTIVGASGVVGPAAPSAFANMMAQEGQSKTAMPQKAQQGGQNAQGRQAQLNGQALPMPKAPVVAGVPPLPAPAMRTRQPLPGMPGVEQQNVARAHNLAQAQMDRTRTQALETLTGSMSTGGGPLDSARNAVTMRNLRSVLGGFSLRAPAMPMADSIKAQALQNAHRSGENSGRAQHGKKAVEEDLSGMGHLAAQFESGGDGIAAIGYDRVGGTSYGKYQVASRVGSMDNFLKFLDTAAPDISKTLREAGPANTGSRKGSMPDAWRKVAAAQPERFEALQDKFIYDSHYKPALEAVTERTQLDGTQISSAMQEVLLSTAVQHGPNGAARIFTRAAENAGKVTDKNFDKKLINNVYAIRAEQFGSSTQEVQNAVRNRMHREKTLALTMLDGKSTDKA